MFFSFLIPLYNISGYRKRNLEFIYQRLISHFDNDEIEIIFGIQDPVVDPYYKNFDRAKILHCSLEKNNIYGFNKSHIFNQCCDNGINGDFLIFLDADVYFPFHKLKTQLTTDHQIVKPFGDCIFLDEETTTNFIEQRSTVASGGLKRISALGACCIIINKNILPEIRMDENFFGWGWEDIDFANSISKKFYIDIFHQNAVHLYHEPSTINNNNYKYYKEKYTYVHEPYNLMKKKDIGIITSYFSHCDFKKPRENIYKFIESLEHTNIPITVVEAVMPEAVPLSFNKNINHIQILANINSTLFLKENLFNIGIKNTQYKKILFLDSDIFFSDKNFIDRSSLLLDKYDIIQPFENCATIDKDNLPLLDFNFKLSIAKGINNNRIINSMMFHPGFAWAVRRNFLESVGGFYDRHPVGGGDLAFCYAIYKESDKKYNPIKHWMMNNDLFFNTNSYIEYRKKVQNFNPKIGYMENCSCYHMYHGSREKRDYIHRSKKYLPEIINNEYPLRYNTDGLIEWINIKDATHCLEYFKSREEDE